MVLTLHDPRMAATLLAVGLAPIVTSNVRATVPDAAEHSIEQFLAQDDTVRPYRAARRLEAENGSRKAWLEAVTEYSADARLPVRNHQ